jgi:hypothetical protein
MRPQGAEFGVNPIWVDRGGVLPGEIARLHSSASCNDHTGTDQSVSASVNGHWNGVSLAHYATAKFQQWEPRRRSQAQCGSRPHWDSNTVLP